MGEWLVEKGEDGHLIRVPATYFVQIFSEKTSKSVQRLVQKKQESPAEYFYTFALMKIASEPVKNTLTDDLKKAGVSDKVNLKMFPQWKNKIVIRLENLADPYDADFKTVTVDVNAVATALWNSANLEHPAKFASINIDELSLTGNMKISEMRKRKIQWKTVDDHMLERNTLSYESGDKIKLEAQRIRVFAIDISPETTSSDALFMQ